MALEPGLWIRKRGVIESVIGQTKKKMDEVHSRYRSPFNTFANLFAALVAYSFKPQRPSTYINLEARLLPATDSMSRVA